MEKCSKFKTRPLLILDLLGKFSFIYLRWTSKQANYASEYWELFQIRNLCCSLEKYTGHEILF